MFSLEIMVDLMLWLKHCHTHVFPGDNGLSNVVDDAHTMFSPGDNG